MGISSLACIIVNFFILLLLFFLFIYVTIKDCSPVFNRHNESTIRFPFRLTDRQPDSCGYPGFELSCDSANQTILKLPYSGEFSVQAIDYVEQELRLKDPNNCLPQKLLSLNLSGSPFMGKYYQNVSFYNCSLDHFTYGVKPISCLSGPYHNIYATSYIHAFTFMSSNCTLVNEISIPMQLPYYYGKILSRELNKDLRLTWTAPYCEGCQRRGGQCRKITCSTISGKSWLGCGAILVFLWLPVFLLCVILGVYCLLNSSMFMASCGIGVLGAVCFLFSWIKNICRGVVCVLCSWVKNICGRGEPIVELTSTIAPQPTIITPLGGHTFESYPKIVLGESRRLPKPDDDTCSICISEYKPKEILKTIPKCNHCFHANCIDEWLRLNPTCPICRNSP